MKTSYVKLFSIFVCIALLVVSALAITWATYLILRLIWPNIIWQVILASVAVAEFICLFELLLYHRRKNATMMHQNEKNE
jgi:hypothetical protein